MTKEEIAKRAEQIISAQKVLSPVQLAMQKAVKK